MPAAAAPLGRGKKLETTMLLPMAAASGSRSGGEVDGAFVGVGRWWTVARPVVGLNE